MHFFFFNDTATTEIYTLSLHDALPISAYLSYDDRNVYVAFICHDEPGQVRAHLARREALDQDDGVGVLLDRSEEHTSELQSQSNLVCRLLLEKKKKKTIQLVIYEQLIK